MPPLVGADVCDPSSPILVGMYWKDYWFAALTTFTLLVGATLIVHTLVNRDAPNFDVEVSLIDAQKVLTHPKHDGSFEVIFISTGCPGRYAFMPEVIAYVRQLREKGMPYFLINDACLGPEAEAELERFRSDVGLRDTVYYLDRATYPNSGGLLFGKLRYRQFVNELCGSETDYCFGYATTLRFADGKYTNWTVAYPGEARRAALRQQILEYSAGY